jgi:hypothetical protein
MSDLLLPGRGSRRDFLVSAGAVSSQGDICELGDGKETDGKTNRPDCQTNPALFAAPPCFFGGFPGQLAHGGMESHGPPAPMQARSCISIIS